MIVHAQRRWPNAITANLWPYALRTANDILVSTPRLADGVSPMETFSGVQVKPNLNQFHPFGCPSYVLNNQLQQGQNVPKWAERVRVGIYLGPSPQHSRSVGLILNLQNGLCSPQFHVKYDDSFETARLQANKLLPGSNWQKATGFGAAHSATAEHASNASSLLRKLTQGVTAPPSAKTTTNAAPTGTMEHTHADEGTLHQPEHEDEAAHIPMSEMLSDRELPPPAPDSIAAPPEAPNIRRSQRIRQPSVRLRESLESAPYFVAFKTLLLGDEERDEEEVHPLAYKATVDPDTMYLDQALKQPDRHKFLEAMVKDVNDQF